MKTSIALLIPFLTLFVSCSKPGDGGTQEGDDPLAALFAPDEVSVRTAGPSAAVISWHSSSTSYDLSQIERRFGDGTFEVVATVPRGESSYVDRQLKVEGTYSYRIADVKANQAGPLSAEFEYVHKSIVPAPMELEVSASGRMVSLTWKDNCIGEEGYIISYKRSSESSFFTDILAPDTESWTHELSSSGDYSFSVVAFKGTMRSEAASITYSCRGLPVLSISGAEASWWAAKAELKLDDDGGEPCETGLCWGREPNPCIDSDFSVAGTIKTGGSITVLAEYLDASTSYHFRAWARNSQGVGYSEDFALNLKAMPQTLYPEWTDISDQYGMPAQVRLYKSVTSVTGRSVNIWYAIADPSAVEFSTVMSTSLVKPTNFVKNTLSSRGQVYVTVNGGYFTSSGPASYSFIRDRGVDKAKNISSLTRTNTYYLTRGAFGVDSQGVPSVKWVYSDASGSHAYDKALPVIDGNPVIKPDDAPLWDVWSGMGGAPVLVKDGIICFDYMKNPSGKYVTNHELLQGDIFADGLRAPRTAVGSTADGKVVLLVCDGRNAGSSAGLTLDELAGIMKGLGCTDALNLDGGGSSMICTGNEGLLLNNPSDGTQRSVLSFVSFMAK